MVVLCEWEGRSEVSQETHYHLQDRSRQSSACKVKVLEVTQIPEQRAVVIQVWMRLLVSAIMDEASPLGLLYLT